MESLLMHENEDDGGCDISSGRLWKEWFMAHTLNCYVE
jgi:hypothetical protein